jgi:hypothetical protein
MPRKSLQGGFCNYPDASCALESTDCLTGTDAFSSSRQMQTAPGAHGGYCLLQDSVKEIAVGKCGNGSCSPNAESCGGDGSSYTIDTSTSDTVFNPACTIETTKFGKCGDRCSWSPQDCNANEEWTFPVSECTCDKVRVGGCVKSGFTYCSVSNLACDSASIWFGPTAVTAETGNECYVCRQSTPIAATDDDKAVENDDGTEENYVGEIEGGTKDSPKKASTGVFLGASLGSVAGVASLIVIFALVKHKRNKAKRTKQHEPPVTVPSTNDENGEDVSVL